MANHIVRWLMLAVVLSALCNSQTVPIVQEGTGPSSRFPVMLLRTHMLTVDIQMGCCELIVGNGAVQVHDLHDQKNSFSFPIADLTSLEEKHGPYGLPVLRITFKNKKHFDLVPQKNDPERNDPAMTMHDSRAAMEKAIRDLAAQNKVDLK